MQLSYSTELWFILRSTFFRVKLLTYTFELMVPVLLSYVTYKYCSQLSLLLKLYYGKPSKQQWEWQQIVIFSFNIQQSCTLVLNQTVSWSIVVLGIKKISHLLSLYVCNRPTISYYPKLFVYYLLKDENTFISLLSYCSWCCSCLGFTYVSIKGLWYGAVFV